MWTVNFQTFKLHLEHAEEQEIKLPTSVGSLKKQEFQKNIYFCFIDDAKAFDCVNHNNLWKILKEMGVLDHLTCLLRNMYAGQEATVKTVFWAPKSLQMVTAAMELNDAYSLEGKLWPTLIAY